MMKIAHIGDAHLGLGYPGPTPQSRFEDICRVMNWVQDEVIEQECDLVLFAGDAFKDSKVMLDRAAIEIDAFVRWLNGFASAGIPVVVISGTPSHDAISAYGLIEQMNIPLVQIVTRPRVVEAAGVKIACVPGLNRSQIATAEECKGLSAQEIHKIMTDKLTDVCYGLKAQGGEILLSHLTLAGCDAGFDELVMQHEPILTQEAAGQFKLSCLGHIHRPQVMEINSKSRAYYCGSPERLTFNDEYIKAGFWIHRYDETGRYEAGWEDSEFINTPAREFLTISPSDIFKADLRDKVVRVRAEMSEAEYKAFDRQAFEKDLYAQGAFYVTEIRIDVNASDRARDETVREGIGTLEAVKKWCAANEIDGSASEMLVARAAKILEEVAI